MSSIVPSLTGRSNEQALEKRTVPSLLSYKKCIEEDRLQSFEQMMRHDSHRKVKGRVRQQRWGES